MPECFIIMPVTTPESYARACNDAEHFKHVIDHLIWPAVESAGFTPVSPIAQGADVIHAEIIRQLQRCELVLCDMSSLNVNVFFELGIRTGLNLPISLIRDEKTEKLPFDTSLLNYFTYDSSLAPWKLQAEVKLLAEHIRKSGLSGDGKNPLWQCFGLSERQPSAKLARGLELRVDTLSKQMEELAKKLASTDDVTETERDLLHYGSLAVAAKQIRKQLPHAETRLEEGRLYVLRKERFSSSEMALIHEIARGSGISAFNLVIPAEYPPNWK